MKKYLPKSNTESPMHSMVFKGCSATTNLLEFIDYSLAAMENGCHVEALYTDYSKAFDRVDIPMLLFKLHKMGIT